MLSELLDCTAFVWRESDTFDDYGTPTGKSFNKIGTAACAYSRRELKVDTAENVRPDKTENMRIYFLPATPIKEGDIVDVVRGQEIIGSFRLEVPYCPRGHHIEVDAKEVSRDEL